MWFIESLPGWWEKFSSLSRATEYPASDFVVELRACFGIDVEKDHDEVHPPSICGICRRLVSRYRDAIAAGRQYSQQGGGCGVQKTWAPHSTSSCSVCSCGHHSFTGRPKMKRRLVTAQHDVTLVDLDFEEEEQRQDGREGEEECMQQGEVGFVPDSAATSSQVSVMAEGTSTCSLEFEGPRSAVVTKPLDDLLVNQGTRSFILIELGISFTQVFFLFSMLS